MTMRMDLQTTMPTTTPPTPTPMTLAMKMDRMFSHNSNSSNSNNSDEECDVGSQSRSRIQTQTRTGTIPHNDDNDSKEQRDEEQNGTRIRIHGNMSNENNSSDAHVETKTETETQSRTLTVHNNTVPTNPITRESSQAIYTNTNTNATSSSNNNRTKNKINTMESIFCIDFEGVLFDSTEEWGETGWRAAQQLWPKAPWLHCKFNHTRAMQVFRAVRPCIKARWEVPLLLRLILVEDRRLPLAAMADLEKGGAAAANTNTSASRNHHKSPRSRLLSFLTPRRSRSAGAHPHSHSHSYKPNADEILQFFQTVYKPAMLQHLKNTITPTLCQEAMDQAQRKWMMKDPDSWLAAHEPYTGACQALKELLEFSPITSSLSTSSTTTMTTTTSETATMSDAHDAHEKVEGNEKKIRMNNNVFLLTSSHMTHDMVLQLLESQGLYPQNTTSNNTFMTSTTATAAITTTTTTTKDRTYSSFSGNTENLTLHSETDEEKSHDRKGQEDIDTDSDIDAGIDIDVDTDTDESHNDENNNSVMSTHNSSQLQQQQQHHCLIRKDHIIQMPRNEKLTKQDIVTSIITQREALNASMNANVEIVAVLVGDDIETLCQILDTKELQGKILPTLASWGYCSPQEQLMATIMDHHHRLEVLDATDTLSLRRVLHPERLPVLVEENNVLLFHHDHGSSSSSSTPTMSSSTSTKTSFHTNMMPQQTMHDILHQHV